MRRKLFRSYYSKLTLTCLVAVFCTVSFVAPLIIYFLHADRVTSTVENYDTVLKRMAQSYDEIWDDYYMVFKPIYDDANAENFASGSQQAMPRPSLPRIWSACFRKFACRTAGLRGFISGGVLMTCGMCIFGIKRS